MDIITQGLLGAATFAVVMDSKIGKKSLLIGAAAGILPDMDVLLAPFFNDVEFLTVHRSVSHSLIFTVLISLLFAYLMHRRTDKEFNFLRWTTAFTLAICTHPILDWFTTYGTKLISPIDDHLFSLNSIHVFEPIYTGILLVGVAALWYRPNGNPKRTSLIRRTLIVSSLYLGMTCVSKNHAFYHFESQLAIEGIEYSEILVSPTPLNSLLWHGIVKCDDGYYFGTYSIFDRKKEVAFQFVKSDNEAVKRVEHNRLVKYFLEYTQGYPLIERDLSGDIRIYAVKYGPINYFGEPQFVQPLTFNEFELDDTNVRIDYSGEESGPVKSWRNLFRRIRGKRS